MHQIIALWTHPRSISTAMERVMMERGDLKVLHEPFSLIYYVTEQKADVPYVHDDPDQPHTYPEAKDYICGAAGKDTVFFKDMCYHCFEHVIGDDDFLGVMTNTFLIREPIKTIGSHYNINPDVTTDEIGYEQQFKVFEKVEALTGRTPIVIDADDLEDDPEGTVAAYSKALGIPHLPESLTWGVRHIEEWETWKEWHADAARSTGIQKNMEPIDYDVLAIPKLKALYDYHLPSYQAMYANRITAAG